MSTLRDHNNNVIKTITKSSKNNIITIIDFVYNLETFVSFN